MRYKAGSFFLVLILFGFLSCNREIPQDTENFIIQEEDLNVDLLKGYLKSH